MTRWIFLLMLAAPFFSCTTSPFTIPRENEAVMVVILENLTNQKDSLTMQIGGQRRVLKFPVQGKELYVFILDRWEQRLFDVEMNSINLYPQVYVLGREGLVYRDLIPEDKRLASELLIDTYGFYHWADRRPVNFHPYLPRRMKIETFPVSLETNVPAQVWIDAVNWGTTPLTADLPLGKHQIIYRKDNRELFRSFLDVRGEEHFYHTLTLDIPRPQQDFYRVTMRHLDNQGDPDLDYLQPLIEEGIKGNIHQDSRIYLSMAEEENAREEAEHQGAEILLRGSYYPLGSQLLIQIVIEDIKTGQIRSSELYQADLGLEILSRIEDISKEISQSIRRQLPEPGETFYQVVDHFDQSLVVLEQALAVDYIEKVQGRAKNLITLEGGIPFQYAMNHDNGIRGLSLFSLGGNYQRRLKGDWSARMGYRYIYSLGQNLPSSGDSGAFQYHSLYSDVLYNLIGSEQRNLYIGAGVSLDFLNAGGSLLGADSSLEQPLRSTYMEPRLSAGTILYLNKHISEPLWYTGVDLAIPMGQFVLSADDNIEVFNPLNIHALFGRRF